MNEEQVERGYNNKAEVLGQLMCTWAAKMDKKNWCPVDAAEMMAQGKGAKPQQATIPVKQFKLRGEPLYGGKGKRSGPIYNHCDTVSTVHDHGGGHPRPGKVNDTHTFDGQPRVTRHHQIHTQNGCIGLSLNATLNINALEDTVLKCTGLTCWLLHAAIEFFVPVLLKVLPSAKSSLVRDSLWYSAVTCLHASRPWGSIHLMMLMKMSFL